MYNKLWQGLHAVKQWAYPTPTSPKTPAAGGTDSGYGSPRFHPVIQELQELIENDPVLFMGFSLMFEQVPTVAPFNISPDGTPQIRNYMDFLHLLNDVIHHAPPFSTNAFVGFPINAALNWPMGTPAGLSVLTNDKVNAQFKRVFDVWAAFLRSPGSRHVLTGADDGWFGLAAREAMPDFEETFECDERKEFKGFKSWDNFFTRRFRAGVRPLPAQPPSSSSSVMTITSPCESTIYRIRTRVLLSDQFWLKNQPYSLHHMLASDPLAQHFTGGTVYQAYLNALNYHRWHAPLSGTVRRIVVVPGTYYAECPAMGFPDPDPVAQCGSQAYLTSVATRALVFIDGDGEGVGLVCFVAVGMAEVSTCEVTVKEGQRVEQGDEIGMFHYGGSTCCLVFRPETRVEWVEGCEEGKDVRLNAAIARVSSAK